VYRRWLWPGFALPGVLWLLVLFVVPFYAVVAIAFGTGANATFIVAVQGLRVVVMVVLAPVMVRWLVPRPA
jgi:uncharacterized membrane protein AbrB (regulator of aidB expression)